MKTTSRKSVVPTLNGQKLTENQSRQMYSEFNSIHDSKDKKQALLVFLKKYINDSFGNPVSLCGKVSITDYMEVTFDSGLTITFA